MKKVAVIGSLILMVALFWVSPVMAAGPNENASHVAFCAVTMGGQHVAECARNMAFGVSLCAQTEGTGLCDLCTQ